MHLRNIMLPTVSCGYWFSTGSCRKCIPFSLPKLQNHTELCYGVDPVHLMLRQANYELGGCIGIPSDVLKSLGRPKPLGSAIEARVYAEVPLRDFVPSPGVLQHVHWPEGEGVRVDTWVRSGQRITPLYDRWIGKVIAYSPDGRVAAQKKMLAVLAETALQGTQSNLEYFQGFLTLRCLRVATL